MYLRKFFRRAMPALITLILLATAVGSYAWLATDRFEEIRLGADDTPDISIRMATYEPPAQQGEEGTYVWRGEFVPVEKNHLAVNAFGNTSGTADFKIDQLAFGEIDNLDKNSLKSSNFVWFCLKVHEDEGLTFRNLKVTYAQEPFIFYDQNGTKQPTASAAAEVKQKFESFKSDVIAGPLKDLMVIMPAQVFCTKEAPATFQPGQKAIQQYSENFRLNTDTAIGGLQGKATEVDADGYYYVYFRAHPNIDAYILLLDKLYQHRLYDYMPFYLQFQNLTVSVDITTK